MKRAQVKGEVWKEAANTSDTSLFLILKKYVFSQRMTKTACFLNANK